jgi:hypothetical protein
VPNAENDSLSADRYSVNSIFVVRLGTLEYGGLDVFGGLLYFGIICRAALVMLRSDFRRTMSVLFPGGVLSGRNK